MKLVHAFVVLAGLTLLPLAARATDGADDMSFRVNGPVRVGQGESVSTVVVVRGDAIVKGTVRDALVVVGGTANIWGRVDGRTTVVNGNLRLREGATVRDVNLVNAQIDRAPGATILGTLDRRAPSRWNLDSTGMGLVIWLSMTVTIILAALLYAAIGGRQLERAREVLTREPGRTALGAAFIWLGVPALAVLALVSVVGIPFGLGLLLMVLPVVWFAGYLATAATIGMVVVRRRPVPTKTHPYGAAALGALVLQSIALVPVLGVLVGLLAGVIGSGALALLAARQIRGSTTTTGALPVEA